MQYPKFLRQLIDALTALPGVGPRTAERFAFRMLEWPEGRIEELAQVVAAIPDKLGTCETCGCLLDENGCRFCPIDARDPRLLCVVASPKDVFAIEGTGEFRGRYHVLSGLLSPIEGRGVEVLHLGRLKNRLGGVEEAIIALDSTVEGDATALYLKRELESMDIAVSRLAFGLPMGSPLDYVDGGTLARAFSGRNTF